MNTPTIHNPGPLKHKNKSNKLISKNSKKRKGKGRTSIASTSQNHNILLSKQVKRNKYKQLLKNQREEVMQSKRIGHTNQGPPRIIVSIIF